MDFVDLVDWAQLEATLGVAVTDTFRQFATDEASDLKEFGAGVATHFVAAIKNGDAEMRAELLDQVKALAAISKMRLEDATWTLAGTFLSIVFKTAIGALKSALVP